MQVERRVVSLLIAMTLCLPGIAMAQANQARKANSQAAPGHKDRKDVPEKKESGADARVTLEELVQAALN